MDNPITRRVTNRAVVEPADGSLYAGNRQFVPVDLRGQRRQRIDAQHLAELEQIREHIGDLVRDPVRRAPAPPSPAPTPPASTTGRSPPVRTPPRSAPPRGSWGVVLLPVARRRELGQPALQSRHIRSHARAGPLVTRVTLQVYHRHARDPARAHVASPTAPTSRMCPRAHIRRGQPQQFPRLPPSRQRSKPSASTVSACSAAGTSRGRVHRQHPRPGEQHQRERQIAQLPVAEPPQRRGAPARPGPSRAAHRPVRELLGDQVRDRPRAARAHRRDEQRVPPCALACGCGAAPSARLSQPPRSRPGPARTGAAHPVRPGVAGEHRPQRDHHLLGRGQHQPLPVRLARHAQRQQRRAEPVVGQRGAGDRSRARRVPGGLDRGAARGRAARCSAGSRPPPVNRSPTMRSSGSACTARSSRTGPAGPSTVQPMRNPRRPWRVGPRPVRHAGRRVAGTTSASAAPPRRAWRAPRTPAARWTCRCRSRPRSRVSGPSGKTTPRWDLKADSRNSVTAGRAACRNVDAGVRYAAPLQPGANRYA